MQARTHTHKHTSAIRDRCFGIDFIQVIMFLKSSFNLNSSFSYDVYFCFSLSMHRWPIKGILLWPDEHLLAGVLNPWPSLGTRQSTRRYPCVYADTALCDSQLYCEIEFVVDISLKCCPFSSDSHTVIRSAVPKYWINKLTFVSLMYWYSNTISVHLWQWARLTRDCNLTE